MFKEYYTFFFFSCDIAFLFPESETGDTDGGVGRTDLLGNKDPPESLKRYKLNGKLLLVLAGQGRSTVAACQGQKCILPGNQRSSRFMETCVPLCTASEEPKGFVTRLEKVFTGASIMESSCKSIF